MSKRVTIRDIAKKSGVSTATISRLLNNYTDCCSLETRKRIMAAIEEMNYRPNPIARSLATKRFNNIALIIPDVRNPFFTELSRGAEDVCNENGFNLMLCNTDGLKEKEDAYINNLFGMIDGAIITTQNVEEENSLLVELSEQGLPLATVERYAPCADALNGVRFDNLNGSIMAANLLLKHGHTKIMFITGPLSTTNARHRLEGYLDAMKNSGVEIDQELIRYGNYKIDSGYESVGKALREGKEFTAVMTSNDMMAIGACKALREHGKRIPEDISVTGFDGTMFASIYEPPIVSVIIPAYEMGASAANQLMNELNKTGDGQRILQFAPALTQGSSVADVKCSYLIKDSNIINE